MKAVWEEGAAEGGGCVGEGGSPRNRWRPRRWRRGRASSRPVWSPGASATARCQFTEPADAERTAPSRGSLPGLPMPRRVVSCAVTHSTCGAAPTLVLPDLQLRQCLRHVQVHGAQLRLQVRRQRRSPALCPRAPGAVCRRCGCWCCRNLHEQFQRVANIYFLLISVLQVGA